MNRIIRFFIAFASLFMCIQFGFAQTDPNWNSALDSVRAAEESKSDTVIYSARWVRYTTLEMMKKGTFTWQIDTVHKDFQYYNPQLRPKSPTIHLGSYGLATRDLLFEPEKTIGFQLGRRSLERFLYTTDSVKFYRARAPYSELYNIGFFFDDQILKATVTQNINERLNVGGEFHAAGTQGYYVNQKYNDLKWVFFAWYESKNKRYNLQTAGTFNTLKSTENGSVLNDTLFRDPDNAGSMSQFTRLSQLNDNRPLQTWRNQEMVLRQSFYIGAIDTLNRDMPEEQVLPTNRFFHVFRYKNDQYTFFKNEADVYGAFPKKESFLTEDTTLLTQIHNEFGYSFYLRPKSKGVFKNEIKLDLGFEHDFYWLTENTYAPFFQNSTAKAAIGYSFSDRIDFLGDFRQVVQGENAGDFLYDLKADVLLSNSIGRIQFGVYSQNKSPEWIYKYSDATYHQWVTDLDKEKTNSAFFTYINPKLGFKGTASYYLINNYTYFKEVDNPNLNPDLFKMIEPTQFAGDIHLLKISVDQNFKFNRFRFDNHIVFQKSESLDILSTPELYTWHSFYYNGVLNKTLDYNLGLDVRFNTPFQNPSYAINVSQFYQDNARINFSTYPIMDVWGTMTLKRVNIFLSYNFLNQNFYPKGYYTVRRYPMQDANFRIGVRWKFYD